MEWDWCKELWLPGGRAFPGTAHPAQIPLYFPTPTAGRGTIRVWACVHACMSLCVRVCSSFVPSILPNRPANLSHQWSLCDCGMERIRVQREGRNAPKCRAGEGQASRGAATPSGSRECAKASWTPFPGTVMGPLAQKRGGALSRGPPARWRWVRRIRPISLGPVCACPWMRAR